MSTEDATAVDSLYREVDRSEWARLAAGVANPLSETEVVQLRGIGDRLDVGGQEVARTPGRTCLEGCLGAREHLLAGPVAHHDRQTRR